MAGREKRKVDFKSYARTNRKAHTELYDEQDAVFDLEGMPAWEYDDHHTYGHLLMDSVRDVRKYHAKAFRPPAATHCLRFERSFTHGDKHQAEDRKVKLRVTVSQLGLKGPELHKFLLLAGVRYNPSTDELVMSEDRETTSLLNKKRLAETVSELVAEAKKKDDMFADVPLNFHHHKSRPRQKFPVEWLPKQPAAAAGKK
ncbi:hypothetical protein DL89DRAFT_320873 [Linderina pennispora]|uniref:Small ribosomal subunit protein mS35 mitochondrial conserved domain-containing protein n=1 Tax=Linderina pennispora TaxID=61395 RepID=A0A1Y1WIF1_9FUNG|nr:uncharacterized protein DL89DRAFT_320873 [Linderina pennispora]ORX73252.1 hypothetical protein DL89DRAFT_320873 [Linderina pennispora]